MPVASPVFWALSALALLAGASRQESSRAAEPAELSVADFGATPNDGQNDAPGLRAALEACRRRGPTTLRLPRALRPPGRGSRRSDGEVMSGAFGINPESTIFRPTAPTPAGLDFTGVEDLTVEAEGPSSLADGWMEPLSLESCRNITIRGPRSTTGARPTASAPS